MPSILPSDIARLLRRPGYLRYAVVVATARATGTMFNGRQARC